VNFCPSALGKKMNEEELIQRVFQDKRVGSGQNRVENGHLLPEKNFLDLGCFIWNGPHGLRMKIKFIISVM
jgi:hypothetical protein